MTGRAVSLVIVATLASAACSAATETTADETTTTAAASTTLPPPATTTSTSRIHRGPTEVDELAFKTGDPDAAVSGFGSSGESPVTTIQGGGAADIAIYRGVLGGLGPEEVVAEPVVAAPVAAPGAMPLTGALGVVPDRPAAVVKIDNSPAARPQTGLNEADIVVEEEVEGGITRLAAVFHSRSSTVGPVRSARTTDIGVLGGLGTPLLMYSGANDVTNALIRAQEHVQNRSFETSSGYWRNRGRRAPSNLYSDTGPQWASAHGGPPPAQFAFRAVQDEAVGDPVVELSIAYRSNSVGWSWDGTGWLRRQGGSPHVVASGEQVSAANVVVVETREVATGMVDSTGSNVPEFVYVGTGPASVFTGGRWIDGIWTRPTLTSVATFTTEAGEVIRLAPGRTWIEIVEVGAGMLTVSS